MFASLAGRDQGHGRRRVAIGALALGCVLGGVSACSDDAASPTEGSATSAAPTSSAPASPSASPGVGAATGTASPAASASTDSGPAADAVVTISVKGRTITPAPGRRTLSVGDRVQLVVTTDTANVLHVHGVEIERDLKAGVPLTVNLTVKDPGVYAVELHEPELLLVQLVVR